MCGGRSAGAQLGRELVKLGGVGDETQRTAQCARPVERALRTAQDLDLFQIVQLEVAAHRRIAHVGANRVLLEAPKTARLASGVQTTDYGGHGAGIAGTEVKHTEAGNLGGERLGIDHAGAGERAGVDHTQAIWHLFYCLHTPGRCDSDLFERRRGAIILLGHGLEWQTVEHCIYSGADGKAGAASGLARRQMIAFRPLEHSQLP